MGWFDTVGPGELSTRVAELTGRVHDGLGQKFGDVIRYTTQIVLSFAAAFYLDWELTLVLFGTLPVIAIAGEKFLLPVKSISPRSTESERLETPHIAT